MSDCEHVALDAQCLHCELRIPVEPSSRVDRLRLRVRALEAVADAAKELERANDRDVPIAERPRTDIAWARLKKALAALDGGGDGATTAGPGLKR